LKKVGLLNAARDRMTAGTMPEGVVIEVHRVWTKMNDSVAAPRILNMAAQFMNVDQLSTMYSVFVKKQTSGQTMNPKCLLSFF
jgi:hypothetical protein